MTAAAPSGPARKKLLRRAPKDRSQALRHGVQAVWQQQRALR